MFKKYITILNKFIACLIENRPNLIGGGSIFDYDPQVIKKSLPYNFCFGICFLLKSKLRLDKNPLV